MLTLAIIATSVPSKSYGITYGIIAVVDSAMVIQGNLIFSFIYRTTGNYQNSMISVFILSIIGIFILLIAELKKNYLILFEEHIPDTNEIIL